MARVSDLCREYAERENVQLQAENEKLKDLHKRYFKGFNDAMNTVEKLQTENTALRTAIKDLASAYEQKGVAPAMEWLRHFVKSDLYRSVEDE